MNNKVLVLGTSGMLGHRLFQHLIESNIDVYGTLRRNIITPSLVEHNDRIYTDIDANDFDAVLSCIRLVKPSVIINCIGIIKQKEEINNYSKVVKINSLFPHVIAEYCEKKNIHFIHISTDCVFNGKKGNYSEIDPSDAEDFYGKSKSLGEVINYQNSLTIRTSIIGHEISGNLSLLEWFLKQENEVNGFTGAIYSGLTTNQLSKVIKHYILPRRTLSGLYQISSYPISKYELLKIIASVYKKDITIQPVDYINDNKTLLSDKFLKETNYSIPSWKDMVLEMYEESSYGNS